MTNNIKTGQIGEDLACQYLSNNGYKIIERNVRYPWGEIDIIAKNKAGVLIFVEVKALRAQAYLKPEDNLSQSKLEKLKRTAYLYANSHPELVNDNRGWQIDLIAIEIDRTNPESLTTKELLECSSIRYYENI